MQHLALHHFTAIKLFLLLIQYGYVLLFPIAVIEGPIAAIIAGALAASGEFTLTTVFILLVIADLLGDCLYYSLGRWGHERFLEGIASKLGLTEKRMAPLAKSFHKSDWKLLLLGKVQGLGSIILYFAGVTKMGVRRFLFWNLVGTLPKVFLFEAIGYLFGQTLINSPKYIDYVMIVTFLIGLGLLFGYWKLKDYIGGKVNRTLEDE
jgi:membrane protein DedA with SNARE-associated domain